MNRREFLKTLEGIFIGSIPFIYSCSKNPFKSDKLRICPDAWYDNQMPGEVTKPREYLIINGKRRELDEFDIEWIRNNCAVNKPTIVY